MKKDAAAIVRKASMLSIITSGCSFLVATFGVAAYSQVEMVSKERTGKALNEESSMGLGL